MRLAGTCGTSADVQASATCLTPSFMMEFAWRFASAVARPLAAPATAFAPLSHILRKGFFLVQGFFIMCCLVIKSSSAYQPVGLLADRLLSPHGRNSEQAWRHYPCRLCPIFLHCTEPENADHALKARRCDLNRRHMRRVFQAGYDCRVRPPPSV